MRRERASALLGVLVVSMLASMVVVSLLYRLLADAYASEAALGNRKAWEAAMSGVEVAAAIADRFFADPDEWVDRADRFRSRLVADDGTDRWYFTVYWRGDDPTTPIRYGLSDEGARLNVHMLPREVLVALPGMDEALADALLDAIDPADGARSQGAEADAYTAAEPPYTIRDGRLRTIDELLLVRGFHGRLLYGEDADADGRLDACENDGSDRFPPDDGDGELDGGLRDLLTVWNVGLAVDQNRVPQVDLNRDVDRLATLGLSEETLRYLAALRAQAAAAGNEVAIGHPVELLDAELEVADAAGGTEVLRSGIGPVELANILDRTKAHEFDRSIAFRLNVNTATAAALARIPGIDESLADSIVRRRGDVPAEERRTTAWLLAEGLVEEELFVRIAPYLSAKSFQFRFRVIGYGVPSGRYRILEALIDVGYPQPRLVYLRELTRAGPPFPLESGELDG